MTFKNWMGLAAAAVLLSSPTLGYAKHGADDPSGGIDPQPHKRHGADDASGGLDPQPHKYAKHGADDPSGGIDPQPHKYA